jgi:hypothetical protein
MNRIITFCFLLTALFSFSQSNLTIFSNDGKQFYAIMNGIKQNSLPKTNVYISGIKNGNYAVKIIFADGVTADIDKNVMITEPSDITTKITFKKGKGKLQLMSLEPTHGVLTDPSTVVYRSSDASVYTDAPVVTQQTVTTTNTTTTQTTNNQNGGVNMNVGVTDNGTNQGMNQTTTVTNNSTQTSNGGMNMNVNVTDPTYNNSNGGMNMNMNVADPNNPNGNMGINMNVNVTDPTMTNGTGGINMNIDMSGMGMDMNMNGTGNNTGTTQTTSSSSTTTTVTTTQTTTSSSSSNASGGANTNNSGNTNVASNTGGNTTCKNILVDDATFVNDIKGLTFDSDKVDLIRGDLQNYCLTASQAYKIVETLTYASDRLDISKFLYDRMIDKDKANVLLPLFTYDSDKMDFKEYTKR